MNADLKIKLEEYRAKRAFNADEWIEKKCAKLNEYMTKCGLKTCVTSISGGIDSAVTLALCMRAKKMAGSPITHVVGVCQPIASSAWALERGQEAIRHLGAEEVVVDQTDIHKTLDERISTATGIKGGAFASGQLRSYMRTPVGYYVAQLYSQNGDPAIVMGTGNMDEDGYLAYFCKAGDGVVDVQLISDLHKSEVFVVAKAIGVPDSTVEAAPSADLWDGQTDEEELGFTYEFVELFTGLYLPLDEASRGAFKSALPAAALAEFEKDSAAAMAVNRRNAHKIAGIQNL